MDTYQALKNLENEIPNLKITNFTEDNETNDPKGMFTMQMHLNGRTIPCEGHLSNLKNENKKLVEKIKKDLKT